MLKRTHVIHLDDEDDKENILKPSVADESDCIICMEDFDNDHTPGALKCGHVFGLVCIRDWLANGSKTCPICNAKSKNIDIRRVFITKNDCASRRRIDKLEWQCSNVEKKLLAVQESHSALSIRFDKLSRWTQNNCRSYTQVNLLFRVCKSPEFLGVLGRSCRVSDEVIGATCGKNILLCNTVTAPLSSCLSLITSECGDLIDVACDIDQKVLACVSCDVLLMYDMRDETRHIQKTHLSGQCSSLAFSHGNLYIGADDGIHVYDRRTQSQLSQIPSVSSVTSLCEVEWMMPLDTTNANTNKNIFQTQNGFLIGSVSGIGSLQRVFNAGIYRPISFFSSKPRTPHYVSFNSMCNLSVVNFTNQKDNVRSSVVMEWPLKNGPSDCNCSIHNCHCLVQKHAALCETCDGYISRCRAAVVTLPPVHNSTETFSYDPRPQSVPTDSSALGNVKEPLAERLAKKRKIKKETENQMPQSREGPFSSILDTFLITGNEKTVSINRWSHVMQAWVREWTSQAADSPIQDILIKPSKTKTDSPIDRWLISVTTSSSILMYDISPSKIQGRSYHPDST
eukprot:GHVL01011955.1.p1 GENE.GHVL01011955.1~~GHVL01011955.1.p1  ORF type:complete len:567 (+),score=35.04 GHVL01011955.1:95-1795(+)